jgi:hypothetical protein
MIKKQSLHSLFKYATILTNPTGKENKMLGTLYAALVIWAFIRIFSTD